MRLKLFLGALAALCVLAFGAGPALALTVLPVPNEAPAGLPEGRGYELVSPAKKHGDEAGFSPTAGEVGTSSLYSLASASGSRLMYAAAAPVGTTNTAAETFAVGERVGPGDWRSHSAVPPMVESPKIGAYNAEWIIPSSELTSFAFTSVGAYVKQGARFEDSAHSPNAYVTRGTNADPTLGYSTEPTWIGEPQVASPSPALGTFRATGELKIIGGSPSLGTVYFEYPGTLLSENEGEEAGAEKLYEWHEGVLQNAGELPGGGVSAAGAEVANGMAELPPPTGPPLYWNAVSQDGTRLFFRAAAPSTGESALYVREPAAAGAKHSVLVSRNQLAQEEEEAATHEAGPLVAAKPHKFCGGQWMYASPDGSRVFFVANERLTRNAPEGTGEETYEFDTATEKLTYLPEVSFSKGSGAECMVASSANGSTLFYVDKVSRKDVKVDVWHETEAGQQSITPVTVAKQPKPTFGFARVSANGNVLVFGAKGELAAEAPAAGSAELQSSREHMEVYRYDATQGSLECISCVAGTTPSGDAILSNDEENAVVDGNPNILGRFIATTRATNEAGTEVFFQSTQPLVKGAANGVQNVYEWHAGGAHGEGELSLISTGTSSKPSYILDNSANGESVFFATAQPLSQRDSEGGYDVYDARVGGSEPYEATLAGCSTTCRPSAAPQPEAPALTTALSGPSGNLALPAANQKPTGGKQKTSGSKRKAAAKRRHRLRECRRHAKRRHNRRKRRRALRRCAKRYGAKAKGASRHHHRSRHGSTRRHRHRHAHSGTRRRG